ncbi:MAG: EamA family transporter [Bacillota bacterium]|jgi:DME family drug/metabolite transporter|nr:DMT family transporter [Clostridia bacterium]
MELNKTKWGFIFAVFSALFWGTASTFIKVLTDLGLKDITLVAMQPTVLAIFFLCRLLVSQPKFLLINWKYLLMMVFHGSILLGGVNYCNVRAIFLIPVGILSIISFCHIILLMIVTRIVFGYRITKEKISAALIALIGLSLVLEIYQVGSSTLNWKGVFWAALNPIGLSIAYTLIKLYLLNGINYQTYIFYTNLFAAMFFWYAAPPWSIINEMFALGSLHGLYFWLIVLGFLAIPLVGSYTLFGKAYQLIEPTYVSIMFSLEPLMATVLGYFVLHQSLNGVQMLGILITLIPVVYIQYHEGKGKDDMEIKAKKSTPIYSHSG